MKNINKNVDHPQHYNNSSIECIDALNAMVEPFEDSVDASLSWQVVKYIWRHPFKENSIQDVKKAIWYANELLKYLEHKETKE